MNKRDRQLGMDRAITRRDFLHGVAGAAFAGSVADGSQATAAALSPTPQTSGLAPEAQAATGYYPPLLQGLRGSHPGSFEDAHALRDGAAWPAPIDSGEEYDLIIVGGGISGLAAAHFYRADATPGSRILILDNHDDFGGHAKRNEFDLNGRLHLMNGGTLEIDSPRPYGAVAARLLTVLGLDVPALANSTQHLKFYETHGLQSGIFFDRETFGTDSLAVGVDKVPWLTLLEQTPLTQQARRDVVRIETASIDYMPGLSSAAKKQRLSGISYETFLRDWVRVDPSVLKLYQARTSGEWGVGIDAVSALDCWAFDFPGFRGMHLEQGSIARMGYTPAGYAATGGSYKLHFPDGNATIARLLVRNLIPRAIAGHSASDIVTARVDYAELDRADAPLGLRLNSIAVRVRHLGDPTTATQVEVTYRRAGRTYSVKAKGAILACYNAMIPYLCPELPPAQQQALHKAVKTPLVYTSVALRNWQAFDNLKLYSVYAPGSYHTSVHLNPHVNIGSYRSPTLPQDPILVHMVRTPCKPGLTEHEQNRAGRAELLATSFETFERNIRDQLSRTLHAGGFDAARDITALTVNRWPHGYAAEFNPLFDPMLPEADQPHVVGRARFGRIAVANSDAGGAAYTDSAINQGHRAVQELLHAYKA